MKKDISKLMTIVESKLVKRLHEKPSQDTLNRLAFFAGFQDWESFRKEINDEK